MPGRVDTVPDNLYFLYALYPAGYWIWLFGDPARYRDENGEITGRISDHFLMFPYLVDGLSSKYRIGYFLYPNIILFLNI
jgi:hypothetical protein